MRKQNNLDDLFRAKLEDHTLEVPEHIWSNIEAKRTWQYKLANYVKQRKWASTAVLALLFGSIAMVGIQVNHTQGNLPATATIVSLAPNKLSTFKKNKKVQKQAAKSFEKASTFKTEANKVQATVSPQQKTLGTKAKKSLAKKIDKQHFLARKPLPVKKDASEVESNFAKESTTLALTEVSEEIRQGILPTYQSSKTPLLNNDFEQNEIGMLKQNAEQIADNQEVVSTNLVKEFAKKQPINSLILSESRPRQIMKTTSLMPALSTQAVWATQPLQALSPKDDCYRFPRLRASDFIIDAIFAPQYVQQQFINGHQELDTYVQRRKETEQFELAFTTGFRFGYHLKNGFVPKVGIFYSQINETFEFEEGEQRQTTVITTDTLIDAGGNITIVIDTLDVMQDGIRYVKTYNKHRMINVPLLAGYQLDFKNWALELNAGGILNLYARQRGKILSPDDLKPMDVQENEVYKQRYNWNWFASVGWLYKWQPNMALIIEPSIQYTTKPITNSTYAIQQKNTTVGLQTGVRFSF